ncbi:MAG: hypothetical protein P4L86_19535 [Mycobacterium sp.]|nr:hypothetical protein [Mycobacterium sp.]
MSLQYPGMPPRRRGTQQSGDFVGESMGGSGFTVSTATEPRPMDLESS